MTPIIISQARKRKGFMDDLAADKKESRMFLLIVIQMVNGTLQLFTVWSSATLECTG